MSPNPSPASPQSEPWKGEAAIRSLVAGGDVGAALDAAKDAVRRDAAEPLRRETLFNLLCLLGQWESAYRQAQVVGQLDPSRSIESASWCTSIACEQRRLAVFAGRRQPTILGEPSAWIGMLVTATKHLADGHFDAAASLSREARDQAMNDLDDKVVSGSVTLANSKEATHFDYWYDADDRLGPLWEVFADGEYAWVPPGRIIEVRAVAPQTLRDLVWQPAIVTWSTGGTGGVMLPVRYAGTEALDNPAMLLSRNTDFQQPAAGFNVGVGQRLLLGANVDGGEVDCPLLQVRKIRFDVADDIEVVANESLEGETDDA